MGGAEAGGRRENRLAQETSPYLLQHRFNPVDWYPWGDEALSRARDEDKPIFLSVGYSACHWCHVMERESFENDAIAAFLNQHFVSIKVDREERPDIDDVYMKAVQLMTGQGGWPMSVFLTPALEPFYGGTYFPPEDRWGRPGFLSVLAQLVRIYRQDRARIEASAKDLSAHVAELARAAGAPSLGARIDASLLALAEQNLDRLFDELQGGFGGAPKFPHAMDLAFLLRRLVRQATSAGVPPARVGPVDSGALTGASDRLQTIVFFTLEQMARGGIYDQVGGGFARYSTDDEWLVPHFEKMLYDNALLAALYAEASLADAEGARRPLFARVATETIEFVLREMTDERGGFHSAQDADSEGVEGKFFTWTAGELDEVLGADAARFAAFFGVEAGGNFEHGTNILHQVGPEPERSAVEPLRRKVFDARERRVRPGQDDKVLAEWNGLMVSALARAGAHLCQPRWIAAAERAARFLLNEMTERRGGELRLLRVHRRGTSRIDGFLPDYANVIAALLDLAAVSPDPAWLDAAQALARTAMPRFADPDGGFFLTADDQPAVLVRSKDPYDNAVPSGNSMMAHDLIRLAEITGTPQAHDAALAVLRTFGGALREAPAGFGQMLQAVDLALEPPRTVVVVGPPRDASTETMLRVVHGRFRPGVFAIVTDGARAADPAAPAILRGKTTHEGRAAAYVCSAGTCRPPAFTPDDLEALLR